MTCAFSAKEQDESFAGLLEGLRTGLRETKTAGGNCTAVIENDGVEMKV